MDKQQRLKKGKMLLVMPVIFLTFISLGVYAVGGFEDISPKSEKKEIPGINVSIPGGEDKSLQDKQSYYNQAKLDSLRTADLKRRDPYYLSGQSFNDGIDRFSGSNPSGSMDANEAKVYAKLNTLSSALNQPTTSTTLGTSPNPYATQGVSSADIDRLENMMKLMQTGSAGDREPDNEMKQINTTLERILDIQHPELAIEKIRKNSAIHKGKIFKVSSLPPAEEVSLLKTSKGQKSGNEMKFYSLDDNPNPQEIQTGTIKASVNGTQEVVNGAELKFVLVDDIYISGIKIPKGTSISGIAALSGERLTVSITKIQYADMLFPVSLTVYDLTGIQGIRIPGAITRDVAKESANNALQSVNLPNMDPSFAAQAATAGVEMTKTLIGKKVTLVKVTVRSGYSVLLLDENQKNDEQ